MHDGVGLFDSITDGNDRVRGTMGFEILRYGIGHAVKLAWASLKGKLSDENKEVIDEKMSSWGSENENIRDTEVKENAGRDDANLLPQKYRLEIKRAF